ncbi:MAG: hypothetical protein JWR61_1926 [Ferruginibacter sp.]|nr:hypothetical protein [Ferruginibacter sp.]
MYTKNKHQNKTLRKRAFYFGKPTTAKIKAPQRYSVQGCDANEAAHGKDVRTILYLKPLGSAIMGVVRQQKPFVRRIQPFVCMHWAVVCQQK